MSEIVISEFMDEAAVARLAVRHSVLYDPGLADRPEALRPALAETRALIVRDRTEVSDVLIASAPRLACVGRLGVSLDNVDLEACEARSIAVYPAVGANDLSVAEYVVTASLILLRGAWMSTAAVAAGFWPRQAMIGREFGDKTMGLVGYGRVAREVARRAKALGMNCVAFDPLLTEDDPAWRRVRRTTLDDLLTVSDVVSLHTPLTDATRHLIDGAAIAKMKPDAILINAARGGVLDEAALAGAMRTGRLGGAALDVFEVEPLTFEAGRKFEGLENLILTPHIAGVTRESNLRVSEAVADRVLAHLADHA